MIELIIGIIIGLAIGYFLSGYNWFSRLETKTVEIVKEVLVNAEQEVKKTTKRKPKASE